MGHLKSSDVWLPGSSPPPCGGGGGSRGGGSKGECCGVCGGDPSRVEVDVDAGACAVVGRDDRGTVWSPAPPPPSSSFAAASSAKAPSPPRPVPMRERERARRSPGMFSCGHATSIVDPHFRRPTRLRNPALSVWSSVASTLWFSRAARGSNVSRQRRLPGFGFAATSTLAEELGNPRDSTRLRCRMHVSMYSARACPADERSGRSSVGGRSPCRRMISVDRQKTCAGGRRNANAAHATTPTTASATAMSMQ